MKYTYNRPAEIKAYKKQLAFIDDPARFIVIEATTKAGKTVGCITWIFEEALKGKAGDNCWWVAPVYSVAKIAFRRMKRFIGNKSVYTPNESELSITLFNGVMIFFKSADNADSLYGEDVIAAVLDEASRMKEDSWTAVFTTLSATNGRCIMISNVKGVNNWNYKIAREAETGVRVNWSYHKITANDAVEAGILKQEVVDEAERTLPKRVFLELYYGIPNENASNKFFYSFSEDKHVGSCNVDTMYPVYVSFDFNYNPICSGIFQFIEGHIYCIEIIKLENSDIYRLCEVIRIKYGHLIIIVTGDASGSAHSAMVKDNLNYYRIIKNELSISTAQIRVPKANPRFEQNQVLCNAVLEHIPLTIDKDRCQPLIFDLKFAQIDNNGKLVKTDRNDETQQLDSADCFTGDTLIMTHEGDKEISSIDIGEYVLTRYGYKKVIDKWDSVAPVYEFEFSDGTKTKCTKDHKFYSLMINDFMPIIEFYNNKLRVYGINSLPFIVNHKHIGTKKVYDITVQDSHEFFANGMLVHNCFRYYLNVFHRNILKEHAHESI